MPRGSDALEMRFAITFKSTNSQNRQRDFAI